MLELLIKAAEKQLKVEGLKFQLVSWTVGLLVSLCPKGGKAGSKD